MSIEEAKADFWEGAEHIGDRLLHDLGKSAEAIAGFTHQELLSIGMTGAHALMAVHSAANGDWELAANHCADMADAAANATTHGLLGYVEAASTKDGRSYKRSLAGSTLAQASAAQPLQRGTAQRKLAAFLARVRRVNEDDYYLYRVKKVLVFGSYLSAAARINDIDVAIELVHRWQDPGPPAPQRRDRPRPGNGGARWTAG